ncbi:DUF5615 family PIN-like protein [Candidatus Peregrinibacteria bacterium]|nr:DUF5615 family PIN-like protein [Candidatus Peregrinibacteria bacterium]
MSSSTPVIRFLLDENVRADVDRFFAGRKIDAKRLSKRSTDALIAAVSRKERRIVITNDEDFALLSSKQVHGVIWLRIPQSDGASLLKALEHLLVECRNFKGLRIELSAEHWRYFPLNTQ